MSASAIACGIGLTAAALLIPQRAWSQPGASTTPSQSQPPDPRTGVARPASSREAILQAATAAEPAKVEHWIELAQLQEAREAIEAAEHTYEAAFSATGAKAILDQLASLFTRSEQFDKMIATLERRAALDPGDADGHQQVGRHYWEKVQKDLTLPAADKMRYIDSGIAALDRALALRSDYVDALVYKSFLLRLKASVETDETRRRTLLAETTVLHDRAMGIQKARPAPDMSAALLPPPPPPPGWGEVDGQKAVRVGGDIKTPTKLHDARPAYPPEALNAKVWGMVILEAVIDNQGNVHDARVLRSIPLLDAAAREAVKQWKFMPTTVDGVAVPLMMTVTVSFVLQ